MAKGPVLIELDDKAAAPSVAEAPPVPDQTPVAAPDGRAMQAAAHWAARRPSRLARWFWGLLAAVFTAALSAAAWDFVLSWVTRQPILGFAFAVLLGAFVLVALIIALREVLALRRLARIDTYRHAAAQALETNALAPARDLCAKLDGLYAGREDMRWARERFGELKGDQLDASGLLQLAERELMAPLDAAASREVEAAARQVATVTALVPIALADVVAALSANLRMIRRIAEIYGGRSGTLGGWRLTRAVLGHLVATGAVAAGDDLLEPLLGGSVLAKLSRRFGEGLVNGALTARVGVAAMEVCRPLPFVAQDRPRARQLIKRALTGVFGAGSD